MSLILEIDEWCTARLFLSFWWLSHMFVTWLIYTCDLTHWYVCHDSFICVPWLIHKCAMTHSYVWLDPFICATWPIHMCDLTHSYVRPGPFICATWPIHLCDVTHSFVRPDPFIRATWLIKRVMPRIHVNVWLIHAFTRTQYQHMGSLRLVGSLKL